ncbi:hypothetical protein [Haloferax gibbonsii]|uniref:hypothetical protein n=1 Tax=Haloferax gibbonsii TaxID=35746 RepID=UPI001267E0C7|nr:hypothetical protein [Haloferax gibbonsii]
MTGATKAQTGKRKSPIPLILTREVGVAEATVVVTEGRVLGMEATIRMSDDSGEDSGDRRELEKARVADTPDEDPRGHTAQAAEAEATENDTDE